MIINPKQSYTIEDLQEWFEQAQSKNEALIIDPCNPDDIPFFQTVATIRTHDEMAGLTQWLHGLPSRGE